MSFLQVKNRAVSSLASGIDDSVESLTVATGEGAKFPQPGDGFHITIDDEILKCTARSTDVLTVTRAQEGTAAAAHSSGASVSLNITAGIITEIQAVTVPSGLIAMWHGTIANIPSGYVICDGNNSTPNLLAKFVQGVATAETNPGATGGATSKTTSGHHHQVPVHSNGNIYCKGALFGAEAITSEEMPYATVAGSTSMTAVGISQSKTDSISDIRPLFYDVAFIMKT